ncbi:hypothetical protein PCASD_04821 [Puccinia coronata f. sp. avenae]|uniref:Uncharacterized protein n=1 Tax=Puccinia coronata f. sp. avenae TaxID=200324 RepID=A0A2N5V710_9BASI|nr:hypothetical protein PCASD_04821 [Puccinia coronata f. sp. avenae]
MSKRFLTNPSPPTFTPTDSAFKDLARRQPSKPESSGPYQQIPTGKLLAVFSGTWLPKSIFGFDWAAPSRCAVSRTQAGLKIVRIVAPPTVTRISGCKWVGSARGQPATQRVKGRVWTPPGVKTW